MTDEVKKTTELYNDFLQLPTKLGDRCRIGPQRHAYGKCQSLLAIASREGGAGKIVIVHAVMIILPQGNLEQVCLHNKHSDLRILSEYVYG